MSHLPAARRTATAAVLAVVSAALLAACDPPDPRTAGGRPDGARLYALHCEGCHGPDGRKGDPQAQLVRAEPKPAAQLRDVVEQGRGVMPAWKGRLKDEQITAVLEHVRQLGARPPTPPQQGAD